MLRFWWKNSSSASNRSYKKNGINDISVIRGYKKEKINYKDINTLKTHDYKNNNVLNSIFYAEKVINGNIIISYSDILFDSSVVKRALEIRS